MKKIAILSKLEIVLVFAALASIVIFFQIRSNCFRTEFGDDASSHYISGLMIHDYIRSGFQLGPVTYLKWFHSHYPLVGIGHWGPMFYGVEALWMFLFSPSRISVLLLSAFMTALTAAAVYHYGVARLNLGRIAAFFAAGAFVISPITQEGSSAVMLDIPITLAVFLALIAYVRYIETERWVFSLLFGVIAAAAMLIKGNGALLALVPPFAVAFNRKWSLIARPGFWLPVLIVGLTVGPWYAFTYGQVAAGFRYHWGLDYTSVALAENSKILLASVGAAALIVAIVGVFGASAGLKGVLALLAAVWVFQCTAPAAIQDRYLAPLLPPLLLIVAVGGSALAARLRRWMPGRAAEALVFGALVLTMGPAALHTGVMKELGFRDLAPVVWAHRAEANPVVLVAAKESSEAAAIAELAMIDPARPSLFAVRGSRLLGGGGYNRADYLPKFAEIEQAAAEIDAYHVPLVLYQADPGGWTHVVQVDTIRQQSSPPWQLLGTAGREEAPVSLYARPRAEGEVADIGRWTELTGPKALQ